MQWFKGQIGTAISEAKSKKSLFIVYVSGADDLSKEMAGVWEEESVSRTCQSKVVALRLEANSDSCAQFCEFYPVVCVPSTYLIGINGELIEVIGGRVDASTLTDKLSQAIQKHATMFGNSQESQHAVSEQPKASGSQVQLPSEETKGAEGGSVAEHENMLSREEKIERAKELLAKKKEEKLKEEKEKAKAREVERRNLGKNVIKLKEWQKEKEQEEFAKSLKKEKEEERLYREKVKAEIARDRAEKQARYQDQKAEATVQAAKAVPLEKKKVNPDRNKFARIQFRLPDGSSLVNTFSCDQSLSDVRKYLADQIGNQFGSYSLRTTYPARDLTPDEDNKTLIELDMVPSAALVVLPCASTISSVVPSSSSLTDFVRLILSPFMWLWGLISGIVFGTPPEQGRTHNGQQSAASRRTDNTDRSDKARGLRSRQQGNIRRLTADEDSDDMAMYNGNSTQQM